MQILLLIKRLLTLILLLTLISKYDAANWNCPSSPETTGTFDVNADCQLTSQVVMTGSLSLIGTTTTTLKTITAASGWRHFYYFNNDMAKSDRLTLKNLILHGGNTVESLTYNLEAGHMQSMLNINLGGSIFMVTVNGELKITNCVFSNNKAGTGGAIFYHTVMGQCLCNDADNDGYDDVQTSNECLTGPCTPGYRDGSVKIVDSHFKGNSALLGFIIMTL